MLNGKIYRYLLDTNIILYPYDPGANSQKKNRASELLKGLKNQNNTAIPAQVLAEFSSVALRKFKPPLEWHQIELQLNRLSQVFPVLPLTNYVVFTALKGVGEYQLSYYDAQIWAVAKLYQIPFILSEDFNTGSTIDGVSFLNPFNDNFKIESL